MTESTAWDAELTRFLATFTADRGSRIVAEVRCLKAPRGYGRPVTLSGFFSLDEHREQLIESLRPLVEKAELRPAGIYLTLNPIDPSLLARANARLKLGEEGCSAGEQNVLRRHWICVDVDAVRPKGISATDVEKAAAIRVADCVRKDLLDRVWPLPVVIDSGNGVHLYYRVDLPKDDGGLVKRLLEKLTELDDTGAKVDRAMFDPPRIVKLPGTWACKGDDTPERPHRMCRVLSVPEVLEVVRVELIEELAGSTPSPPPHRAGARTGPPAVTNGRLRIAEYLHDRRMKFRVQEDAEGKRYVLDACPFNPDHQAPDSHVWQYVDGATAFKCRHDSCIGRDWTAFSNAIGPPEKRHYDLVVCSQPTNRGGGPGETAAPPAPLALAAAKKSPWPSAVPITKLAGDDANMEWLCEGVIARRHVTLLSALFKAGKTTALSHQLRALQDGAPFFGIETRKCRTLLVTEESKAIWCQRRDRLGLDESVSIMCRVMKSKPTYTEWVGFVHHLLDQAKGHDLVVIDTADKHVPWRNENDNAEIAATILPLNLLTEAGHAVELIHHFGKTDQGEGKAARGGSALGGAVDILLEFRRFKPDDKDDRRRVLNGYGRFDCIPSELVVALSADGTQYAAEGDKKAVAAREWHPVILDLLPEEPPGLKTEDLHKLLPEDGRLRRGDLGTVLSAGVGNDWTRAGAGKRGDPYRYWKC